MSEEQAMEQAVAEAGTASAVPEVVELTGPSGSKLRFVFRGGRWCEVRIDGNNGVTFVPVKSRREGCLLSHALLTKTEAKALMHVVESGKLLAERDKEFLRECLGKCQALLKEKRECGLLLMESGVVPWATADTQEERASLKDGIVALLRSRDWWMFEAQKRGAPVVQVTPFTMTVEGQPIEGEVIEAFRPSIAKVIAETGAAKPAAPCDMVAFESADGPVMVRRAAVEAVRRITAAKTGLWLSGAIVEVQSSYEATLAALGWTGGAA